MQYACIGTLFHFEYVIHKILPFVVMTDEYSVGLIEISNYANPPILKILYP